MSYVMCERCDWNYHPADGDHVCRCDECSEPVEDDGWCHECDDYTLEEAPCK